MRFAAWMVAAAAGLATGCLLDTQGGGGASDGGGGPATGGSTTTVLTTSSTTTTATSTTTTTNASGNSEESESGPRPDAAELVFLDSPMLDLGDVDLQSTSSTSLTVTNQGIQDATSIAPSVQAPFAFTGGAYPGMGGDCGDRLGPGENCDLEVEFSPAGFGPVNASLSLDYDDGQGGATAQLDLNARGTGTLGDLLISPGGEDQGMPPPPGWTVIDGGWQTTAFLNYVGSRSINAGNVNGVPGLYQLRQAVDVSAHATSFSDSDDSVAVEFSGYARSTTAGDDPFSIAVRMLDEDDCLLDEQISSEDSGVVWRTVQVTAMAPPGTSTVEVELRGRLQGEGSDYCSTFFDELALTLTYPAP